MSIDVHHNGMNSNARVTFEVSNQYLIFGDQSYVMSVGNSVRAYMDDKGFVDTFVDMMRFGIEQGLLCPRDPGDCERKPTDCCGREAWECETNIVWDRTNMDQYRECADPMTCGLYDRDDVASLADHANGDAR